MVVLRDNEEIGTVCTLLEACLGFTTVVAKDSLEVDKLMHEAVYKGRYDLVIVDADLTREDRDLGATLAGGQMFEGTIVIAVGELHHDVAWVFCSIRKPIIPVPFLALVSRLFLE